MIPEGTEGQALHMVEDSDLPPEKPDDFFEAWEWNDGVKVNMSRARDIHLTRIRSVRDAELLKLDVLL